MKKLLILILWGIATQTFAQQINSAITSSYYLTNAKTYLSKLDNTIIPSNILLDRALPTSPIADFSGSGIVLTGTFTEWEKLFLEQMNGIQGGYNMAAWLAQEKAYLHRVRDEKIVPIVLQNLQYAKVNALALSNGLLYEQDSFLVEKATYKTTISNADETQRKQLIANLYTTHRTFAASTVYDRIHGNSITFELDSNFYFSNVKNEMIESIEIDFGNGTGYQYVDWNTPITVAYTGTSAFISCAVKFNILDSTTTPQTLYAHFTMLRTGDDVVPSLEEETATNGRAPTNPSERFYFPAGPTGRYVYDFFKNGSLNVVPYLVREYMVSNYLPGEIVLEGTNISLPIYLTPDAVFYLHYDISNRYYIRIWKANNVNLEVSILYAPGNTSGKLRKPLLMVDGFDPSNRRDYYYTACSSPCDRRGLYEIMNGDLHRYYKEAISSNTIAALRTDNYDLVFVDFLIGDDDIITNGNRIIDLLNYINGSDYRDEYTEEMVVVGPSMGGLITRYALKTMENTSTPHYVRQWISFDSPHKGANIPLALQNALKIIEHVSGGQAQRLDALNSPAARQMLMAHYNNNINDFNNLYNSLSALGYPEQCEKIAISNGSSHELYTTNDDTHYTLRTKNIYGTLIVKFGASEGLGSLHIRGIKLKDQTTSYRVTIGQKRGLFVTLNNYPYDISNTFSLGNMPGGLINELEKLNKHPDNEASFQDLPRYSLSTFIPTLSAFGIPLTRSTIDNWSDALSDSPFDKTHYMLLNDPGLGDSESLYGGNQFHLTITDATRSYVLDQMEANKGEMQLPFLSSLSSSRTQTVTGKVAYNGSQSVTFCAPSGFDEFIIDPTATVTATAPTSITFNAGFQIKEGASFSAKIVNPTSGRVSNNVVATTTPINYATTSIYLNDKHSYAPLVKNVPIEIEDKVEESTILLFSVYPTVSKGIYTIVNKKSKTYSAEVINRLGQVIINSTQNLQQIDITNKANGFYFVRILSENKSYLFKIIKE